MTMHYQNDEPSLIDKLNQQKVVEDLAKFITQCKPPQVLGLHGDWGSGKTSLLHQLHLALSDTCSAQTEEAIEEAKDKDGYYQRNKTQCDKLLVIWFEAWRYQSEPVPIVALLHEMREQISWYLKVGGKGKKLLHVITRGALLSMEELTKKIGIQGSKIEKVGVDWEREHLATRLPSNTIREQLAKVINELLTGKAKTTDRKVVVLIDDLDRCESEAAYQLLEGMKMYLTLPNCVFLLGMNQRVIEDSIEKHVKAAEGSEAIKRERSAAYLEKICQNIWRVPTVENPKQFLLDHLPWAKKDEKTEGQDVRLAWIDEAIGDRDCLPPNPRRLKGLANYLARHWEPHLPLKGEAADGKKHRETIQRLLIVAIFHQFHHELYRRWAYNLAFYDLIIKWATGTAAKSIPASQAVQELFEHLDHVQHFDPGNRDESTPVGNLQMDDPPSAFPDPEERTVCWAQPLIVHLYNQNPTNPISVDVEAFKPFFRPSNPAAVAEQ